MHEGETMARELRSYTFQQKELARNKINCAVTELINMIKKRNDTRLKKQWMKVKELSSLTNNYHLTEYCEELLKLCSQLSFSVDDEILHKNSVFEIHKIYPLIDISFSKQCDLIQMKHDIHRLKATILFAFEF